MGETTTLKEKIRGFSHWVHIVKVAREQRVTRLRLLVTTKTATYREQDAACAKLPTGGPLQHPFTVLRCVFDQWSRLQVSVQATDPKKVIRIKGKARDMEEEDNTSDVHRDDVWMAFSIGLQWCSRFTRLLPTDDARARLVDFMGDIRV